MTDQAWLNPALPKHGYKPELQFYFRGEGDKLITTDKYRMYVIRMPEKVKARLPFFAMSLNPAMYLDEAGYLADVNSKLREGDKLTTAPNVSGVCTSSFRAVGTFLPDLWQDVGGGRMECFATGQVIDAAYFKEVVAESELSDWVCHEPHCAIGHHLCAAPAIFVNERLGRSAVIMPIYKEGA